MTKLDEKNYIRWMHNITLREGRGKSYHSVALAGRFDVMARNGKGEVVKTAIVIAIGALVLFGLYGFMKMIAIFADLPIP
jgi:hypothetical protein